jgi:peptidylprolyl isomerase
MKIASLLLLATAATPLAAQTKAVHHAPAAAANHACAKLPELSPKIPALPANANCAKILYTLTVDPSIKLSDVSPMEGSVLRETLGLQGTSFSLEYIDVKVGTGALAAPHKWYSINYSGYLVDGTRFDSSYDRGEPFSFPYGLHHVIMGWDTGFAGMRVGGKRRLIIPYQLAYGPKGNPPTIPPNAALLFDVEFLGQSDTEPAPKTPPAPPAATVPPASSAPAPAATAPTATPPKPQ